MNTGRRTGADGMYVSRVALRSRLDERTGGGAGAYSKRGGACGGGENRERGGAALRSGASTERGAGYGCPYEDDRVRRSGANFFPRKTPGVFSRSVVRFAWK